MTMPAKGMFKFKQGPQSPFGWLSKEGEKAAFMLIHGSTVAEPRAVSNVHFPLIADLPQRCDFVPEEARAWQSMSPWEAVLIALDGSLLALFLGASAIRFWWHGQFRQRHVQ